MLHGWHQHVTGGTFACVFDSMSRDVTEFSS